MVTIFIQGLEDGTHNVELKELVSSVEDLFPEFYGEIYITGKLKKLGNRFTVSLVCSSNAQLICDRTGEEFSEGIRTSFEATFVADNSLFRSTDDSNSADSSILMKEDVKALDITELLRDELGLALPIKRICPQYKEKEFEEMFPHLSHIESKEQNDNDEPIDDRWAVLQSLKYSKS